MRVQTTAPSRGSRRHVVHGLHFVTKVLLAWPKARNVRAPPGIARKAASSLWHRRQKCNLRWHSGGSLIEPLLHAMRALRVLATGSGIAASEIRSDKKPKRNIATRPNSAFFYFYFSERHKLLLLPRIMVKWADSPYFPMNRSF